MPFRSPITQGEDLIKPFSLLAEIPEEGEVRNEGEIKTDGTNREVGGNTYDIPEEGRSEMGISNNVQHAVRPPQIDYYASHAEQEDEDGGEL